VVSPAGLLNIFMVLQAFGKEPEPALINAALGAVGSSYGGARLKQIPGDLLGAFLFEVRACTCVRACVHACVHACVYMCVNMCVCVLAFMHVCVCLQVGKNDGGEANRLGSTSALRRSAPPPHCPVHDRTHTGACLTNPLLTSPCPLPSAQAGRYQCELDDASKAAATALAMEAQSR